MSNRTSNRSSAGPSLGVGAAAGGLRARKKQATRAAISEVATRLFVERGFDNVTVAEIADAADVAKMTVFNYFPRKEDLFFDREEEGRTLVRDALAQRAPGEAPVAALRHLAHRLAEERHPFARFTPATASFWRTVKHSAALSARAREMRDELVRDVGAMLAEAVKRPRDDAHAELAAGLVMTAWIVAYAEGLRLQRRGGAAATLQRAFIATIERGFAGVAAALQGTPYV
ncbi:MAG: TetR/AcrR family transcriptional regulator [Pseudomonadota bacterium]